MARAGDYYLFYAIIGTNGTGKSTWFVEKWLKPILAKNPGKRILIVDPDLDEKLWFQFPVLKPTAENLRTFRGAVRVDGAEEDIIPLIQQNYTNGILLLDDFGFYVEPNLMTPLRRLLFKRRQKHIDIFAITHGFTELPPKFVTRLSHFEVFHTSDNMDRAGHKEKLSEEKFAALKEIVNRVNNNRNFHYHETLSLYERGQMPQEEESDE